MRRSARRRRESSTPPAACESELAERSNAVSRRDVWIQVRERQKGRWPPHCIAAVRVILSAGCRNPLQRKRLLTAVCCDVAVRIRLKSTSQHLKKLPTSFIGHSSTEHAALSLKALSQHQLFSSKCPRCLPNGFQRISNPRRSETPGCRCA